MLIVSNIIKILIERCFYLFGTQVDNNDFIKFANKKWSLEQDSLFKTTYPIRLNILLCLSAKLKSVTTRLTAMCLVNSGNRSKLAKTLSKLGLSCKLGKSEYIRALLTNGSNKSSAFNIVGKVGAIEADSYVRLHLVLIYFVCFNLFTLERSLILAMRKQKKIIIETLSSLLFPHN